MTAIDHICRACYCEFSARSDRLGLYCTTRCKHAGQRRASEWTTYVEKYVERRGAISRVFCPYTLDPFDRVRVGVTGRHYRRIEDAAKYGVMPDAELWEEIKGGRWDYARSRYELACRWVPQSVVPGVPWDPSAEEWGESIPNATRPNEHLRHIDSDISPLPAGVWLWDDPFRSWCPLTQEIPEDGKSVVDIVSR